MEVAPVHGTFYKASEEMIPINIHSEELLHFTVSRDAQRRELVCLETADGGAQNRFWSCLRSHVLFFFFSTL